MLAVYVLTLVVMSIVAGPAKNPAGFLIGVAVASCALIAICWRTGQPPRWRWGRPPRNR